MEHELADDAKKFEKKNSQRRRAKFSKFPFAKNEEINYDHTNNETFSNACTALVILNERDEYVVEQISLHDIIDGMLLYLIIC